MVLEQVLDDVQSPQFVDGCDNISGKKKLEKEIENMKQMLSPWMTPVK